MPHNLTHDDVAQTLAALCGNYTLDVGRTVRTIGLSLPGKAVCAILPDLGDGITRIVYDLDKPHALAHTRAMLREWWASFREPVAYPDGTVELVRRVPPRTERGPVTLSIAG